MCLRPSSSGRTQSCLHRTRHELDTMNRMSGETMACHSGVPYDMQPSIIRDTFKLFVALSGCLLRRLPTFQAGIPEPNVSHFLWLGVGHWRDGGGGGLITMWRDESSLELIKSPSTLSGVAARLPGRMQFGFPFLLHSRSHDHIWDERATPFDHSDHPRFRRYLLRRPYPCSPK